MTDKLYYESSHREDFEAQVISCEPEGEGYKVVLDKTVFFPEGGGQSMQIQEFLEGFMCWTRRRRMELSIITQMAH